MLSALKSISMVWVGMLLGAGLSFATQALLARTLSLDEYGLFSAINHFILVVTPLAGLGAGSYWLKKFGLSGWDGSRWVGTTLKLLTISVPLGLCIVIFGGRLIWTDPTARTLLILLCPILVMQTFHLAACSRFQLEERYGVLSFWRTVPVMARFLISSVVFLMGYDVLRLGVGYCGAMSVLSFVGLALAYPLKTGNISLAGHGERADWNQPPQETRDSIAPGAVLKEMIPFASGSFFGLIYLQSDIFILSFLSGNEAAGLYNAAFAFMAAIYFIPAAIFNQFLLPKYHRWSAQDEDKLLSVFRFGNASMLILGLVVMVGVILVSPYVIPMIFGDKFLATAEILSWLALCIPFRFISSSVGGCLVTKDNMKRKVFYQGTIAVINVMLNFMLIPMYQAYGAVISTVISEILLLATYLFGAQKHVFRSNVLRGWNLNWKAFSQ